MSARILVAAASLAVMGAAALASCKEEETRTVTIDLGVANAGSPGFGCIEEPSAVCGAILDCSLRPRTAQDFSDCLAGACSDGGLPARECVRFKLCIDGDGGIADCYAETCRSLPTLLARTADVGSSLHLYVDYVKLGGTPGCRGSELRSWCRTNGCTLLRRRCIAVTVDSSATASPESAMRAVSEAFGGARLLDERGPEEPVIVRIAGVARSGPCAADEEDISNVVVGDGAVGCAYSCPTILTAATGAVTVDLDLLGQTCSASSLQQCLTLFRDVDGGVR